MNICKNCGKENLDDAKFCDACGTSLIEETPVVETTPVVDTAPVVAETPVVAEKPKKKKAGLIIGIIVAIIAVIAIVAVILLPTIMRAVLGEGKYYLYREAKYLNNKYDVSDISFDGLKNSEIKLSYCEDGEQGEAYALLDIGPTGKEFAIKIMIPGDGTEDQELGTVGVADTYLTLSIPLLTEDVYYIDFDAPTDTDAGLIKAVKDAVLEVDFNEYISCEKDGNKAIFTTDTERLAKYLDDLIVELNKSEDYKALVAKTAEFDEDVVEVLNGTDKFCEGFDENNIETYKYVVTYVGRNGIESREFIVTDGSTDYNFKVYENENKELVVDLDGGVLTLSNFEVKTAGDFKLPTFVAKYEESSEVVTVKLDVLGNKYAFSANDGDYEFTVELEKAKTLDSFTVTPKDKCTLLDEDKFSELFEMFFFGGY